MEQIDASELILNAFRLALGDPGGIGGDSGMGIQRRADGVQSLLELAYVPTEPQLTTALQGIVKSRGAQATARPASQPSPGNASSLANTIASTVLRSGFGTLPLAYAIGRLFGGAKSETPAPLIKHVLPPSRHYEAATATGGSERATLLQVDYGQNGLPRFVSAEGNHISQVRRYGPEQQRKSPEFNLDSPSGQIPQININVQAMDSKSFGDHSYEIAQAVREAMLNMHSINDILSEI